jgi:hypothetical protein
MLEENLSMRIRINSHKNSNYRGKIIYIGASKNFFELSLDRVEKNGASKELSTAQAQIDKVGLFAQGIAENRIEAIGWDENKPLYG